MSPNNSDAPRLRFPGRPASDPDEAQRSLALLTNWRAGSAAASIVMTVLLPFAVAWHVTYLVGIAASVILAGILAAGCDLVRQGQLWRLAASPNLAQLPDLAATRRRLQSARTRRALAAGLRRTADPIQPPRRFDPCPVLTDRAAPVADQLLELANALEQTARPDPASVALIRELLTDGASPLYNPNLPASDLQTTLTRARAGITARARAERPEKQTPSRTQSCPASPDTRSGPRAKQRHMATPHTLHDPVRRPAPDLTRVDPEGIIRRWRARGVERKRARLIGARNRRILARWLRRTANHTTDPHPFVRRRDALLDYRAAAVRTDLLEIAALLEHTLNPDPASVAAVGNLLANGCDSPLYNTDIHISELYATLYYIRCGLTGERGERGFSSATQQK